MAGLPPEVAAGIETDAAAFAQQLAENTPLPHEAGGSPEPVSAGTPGTAQGGDSAEGSAGTSGTGEVETPPAGEGTASQVPEKYMGLDLSDIDPDRRAQIIAHVEEQNQYITRLQQQAAGSPPPTGEPATPAVGDEPGSDGEFQMPGDAEIIAAMGLNPEDPDFETQVKVALPLAKVMLQQNNTLERLMDERQAEQTQSVWDRTMSQLEGQYGTLGVDHAEVVKYAQQHGIADPTAAYWTIAGPVRQSVATQAQEARAEAMALLRKGAAAGRPAGAPSETQQTTIPKRDFSKPGTRRQEARGAFLDALRAAETDTGYDWRSAVAAERDTLANPPATGD